MDDVVTKKVCPCCQAESKTRISYYTKQDYTGNGVVVDEKNRITVLCGDCLLLYKWNSL